MKNCYSEMSQNKSDDPVFNNFICIDDLPVKKYEVT